MELFFFLQALSFSPLRTAVQDFVLELCRQQLVWQDFRYALWSQFPEHQHLLTKILATMKISTDPQIHRLCFGDPQYPRAFEKLMDPPWTLNVFGSMQAFEGSLLTIIGSREPCDESIRWMETELSSWPEAGWSFVSGGARGIDQKAHLLCLRKKKPTLIFLPSGLRCIYPQSLQAWRHQVLDSQSCFVSEFPDDLPMRKQSFSFRNRLLASLGSGLVVIQASEKSGTLMTGHLALALGRPVYVIPGHPGQRHYRGNLELIKLGGQWIENAEDLSSFLEPEKSLISYDKLQMELISL